MKFFRLRLPINLSKPLQRVFRITTPDGTTHVGLLKYERLPNFCFSCGIIGHRFRDCPTTSDVSVQLSDLPFGAWIRGVDNLLSDQLFSKDIPVEPTLDAGGPFDATPMPTCSSPKFPVLVPSALIPSNSHS